MDKILIRVLEQFYEIFHASLNEHDDQNHEELFRTFKRKRSTMIVLLLERNSYAIKG